MPTDQSKPVKVLLFSVLREKAGTTEIFVEIDEPESVNAFLARLSDRIPPISQFRSTVRLAVNGAYAEPRDVVGPGDEVAIITPVSGG